jgi:uncharacterized protein (DUF885 family)
VSESEKTIQEECYGTCWGAQQRIDELNQQLTAANERIKRLEDRINRAATAFFQDGSDGQVASGMLAILEEGRSKP